MRQKIKQKEANTNISTGNHQHTTHQVHTNIAVEGKASLGPTEKHLGTLVCFISEESGIAGVCFHVEFLEEQRVRFEQSLLHGDGCGCCLERAVGEGFGSNHTSGWVGFSLNNKYNKQGQKWRYERSLVLYVWVLSFLCFFVFVFLITRGNEAGRCDL